ncbi:MAG TPA: hypothetical protein VGT78_03665 [Rhizomicrobium sp.]|nr:hypothetical protein [Rhizomicrobium sp.]
MSQSKALIEQINQLRTKWPQAHAADGCDANGNYLIFLPGMMLPKGWNKTICTAFFLARINEPCLTHEHGTASPLNGFFVDLQDLRLADGAMPHYTRTDQPTIEEVGPYLKKGAIGWGHFDKEDYEQAAEKVMREPSRCWGELKRWPQWRGLTRFFWRTQMHDPNRDTLFTAAMLVRQRLNPAR